MADRVVTDLSDVRLRSGMGAAITSEFLQLNSFDMMQVDDDFVDTSNASMSARYQRSYSGTGVVLTLTADQPWGSARMTTGTTNDSTSTMSLDLICRAEYNAVMAVRFKIDDIDAMKVEIGFRDSTASSTGIVNVLDTPSFGATNGCCWVYDNDATVDTWAAEGVKAGSAATGVTLATTAGGAAPIAATYQTMVVALMEDNAYFSRYSADGRKQGETLMVSDCNTGSVAVAPSVFVQTRGTTTHLLDIDFFKMWQLRRS
jgi:hypothetical protein